MFFCLVVIEDDNETFDGKCSAQVKRLPSQTWTVLFTELCERFSYYGVKTVLVIYLTSSLGMTKSKGISVYHAFSMVSYFTGVIGAMLADSWLGKFKTILYSLVLYSLSEIVLTLTTVPSIGNRSSIGPLVGLFTMAVAGGNIKPCMAAFGGDQFNQRDTGIIALFFSLFYMSVNVGAMLTMIFVPIMRTDIKCYGTDCYPAVFGVNAAAIILASISFFVGGPWYVKTEPEGNMMIRVLKMIGHALSKHLCGESTVLKGQHWLYNAQDRYPRNEIEDVRCLLKVLVMYIPLPVFWALFHQQGSSWTLQAEQMDGDLGSLGNLRSDQMQFFNPVLVLMLIPLFDGVIYPVLDKCFSPNGFTPLKRMVGGMLLAGVAFGITGLVQIKIQTIGELPLAPSIHEASIDFINVSPCEYLEIQPESYFKIKLGYAQHSGHTVGQAGMRKFKIKASNCYSKKDSYGNDVILSIAPGKRSNMYLDIDDSDLITAKSIEHTFPDVDVESANTRVRTIYASSKNTSEKITLIYEHVIEQKNSIEVANFSSYDAGYKNILADEYRIKAKSSGGRNYNVKLSKDLYKLGTFGAYTIVLIRPIHQKYSSELYADVYEDVQSTTVHRVWQLPQYTIITAGEVMFSVTGLEFAYSQAPPSMKSVLQAFWLVTTAFGDLIVIFLEIIHPVNGVENKMFLFGAIMIGVAILFSFMSYLYTYSDFSGNSATSPQPLDENGTVEDELDLKPCDSSTKL